MSIESIIKDDLEGRISEDMRNWYTNIVSPFITRFSADADIMKVSNSVRNAFNINSPKIAKFPWLHSVYWFQDNQKLIDVAKDKNSIMHKNFTYLLHSEFDDYTYFPDCYMFYGWARSLMIIGNKDIPNYNNGFKTNWLSWKLHSISILA